MISQFTSSRFQHLFITPLLLLILFFLFYVSSSHASSPPLNGHFAVPSVQFVYDSLIRPNEPNVIYLLSRGGYGVPNRETNPNCTDSTPGLLKYSLIDTDAPIWGVCLGSVTDFGTLYLPKYYGSPYIGVTSKLYSEPRALVTQLVHVKSGDLMPVQVKSNFVTSGFGSPIFVSKSSQGALYIEEELRAYPANKIVSFPTGQETYASECKEFGTYDNGISFVCIASHYDKPGYGPSKKYLATINALSGNVERNVPIELLQGRKEDTFINLFLTARRFVFYASSTLGLFNEGSSTRPDTLVLAKYNLRSTLMWKKYISIFGTSTTSFGYFSIPATFGYDFVIVTVDLVHTLDSKVVPFYIGDRVGKKWKLVPTQGRERELVVIIIIGRTQTIQNAFIVEADKYVTDNGAREVHVTRRGTLVIRGDFKAVGGDSPKTSAFVSYYGLLCRSPFPRSRCCSGRRRTGCDV